MWENSYYTQYKWEIKAMLNKNSPLLQSMNLNLMLKIFD